ncbi:MAG: hypothetical protein CVU38_13900, partial [Chloroflexi bacterium HGW-Chloroflexi-1]
AQLACGLQRQAETLEREAARLSWRGTTWGGMAARRALAAAVADLARGAERCAFWSSDQDQKQVTCAVNHRIGRLA